LAFTVFPKIFFGRYVRSEQYNFSPGRTVYCTIEGFRGKLVVAERVDDEEGSKLVVSEMDPETFSLSGRKTVWRRPDDYVYFGVIDSCVYRDRLWLTFTTAREWGTGLGCEDCWIFWVDPETGEGGKPERVCDSNHSGCSNMTVWRDKVWISYNAGSSWKGDSHLHLRSFDGSTFSEEYILDGFSYVYHPYPAVFNGHLYILFGETSKFGDDYGCDRIFVVEFDGEEFFNCRELYGVGRNAYPHAAEFDNRLFIFWKSTGKTYEKYGYDFQDIAMVYIEKDGAVSNVEHLIEENTYNSGPVPTVFNDRLYVVYTKYTRYYHSKSGLSKWVGNWVVTLSRA